MTKVVYFSGTGNSLMVAKELASRLDGSALVPIVKAIREGRADADADKLILVFPTYLMTVPLPVRQYLALLRPVAAATAPYITAVATCERKGNMSALTIRKILAKKGMALDWYAEVEMPQNSPTGIRPTKGDEGWARYIEAKNTDAFFRTAEISIAEIARDIAEEKREPVVGGMGRVMLEFLISAAGKNNATRLNFYSDATCDGCGLCERVCPAERIRAGGNAGETIVDWDAKKKCYYCFACFNACPNQSILLKNYAKKDGRYINKTIKVEELIVRK